MLKLYNSLSRKLEEFKPISPLEVGIYTCGPTVYYYPHIGNWRTFTLGDLVVRTLGYLGYKVHYVMNITDVGHLTGDNLGDADIGEDKLEKAAKREGKTAWDIAKFYTQDFLASYEKLGLLKPKVFCKATDHIQEQINLVEKIEERGFTYKIADGLYFDTQKYEAAGNKYGQLSTLDKIKAGARVEPNPEKKDPRDFALWKFSNEYLHKRHMEWWFEGPLSGHRYNQKEHANLLNKTISEGDRELRDKLDRGGEYEKTIGFPGWHIECSAMSLKYLGNAFEGEQFYGERSRTIDIHIGGEDHKSTHHPNEIAQSEAATGKKPFVKYWLHGAFLQVDGGRMGKSLGNAYTLADIEKRGFTPEHLRYFYLTGHYRQPLNFTWEGLEKAKQSYDRLLEKLRNLSRGFPSTRHPLRGSEKAESFNNRFLEVITNDLQMPQALAVVWEMMRSNLDDQEKYQLLVDWDRVLGLKLVQSSKFKVQNYTGKKSGLRIQSETELNEEVVSLIDEREMARRGGKWQEADEIRRRIEGKGFEVKDMAGGVVIESR